MPKRKVVSGFLEFDAISNTKLDWRRTRGQCDECHEKLQEVNEETTMPTNGESPACPGPQPR